MEVILVLLQGFQLFLMVPELFIVFPGEGSELLEPVENVLELITFGNNLVSQVQIYGVLVQQGYF